MTSSRGVAVPCTNVVENSDPIPRFLPGCVSREAKLLGGEPKIAREARPAANGGRLLGFRSARSS